MTMLKPVRPQHLPMLSDDEAAIRLPGSKDELNKERKRLARAIAKQQRAMFAEGRRALLVVLQGRDASGKDGVLRRVFGKITPQGISVTSFKAPSRTELDHDFLWRVHQAVPARGMIGVFNRSHYEDVLIVRVNDLVAPAVWKARYEQINAFEQMLTESGTTIVKCLLHVSREVQLERFRERLEDPEKQWKFNAGDLDVRDRWDDYTEAYRDVLRRCSTEWAPWYVVPADHNRDRDVMVGRLVLDALTRMGPAYPAADAETLALADRLR